MTSLGILLALAGLTGLLVTWPWWRGDTAKIEPRTYLHGASAALVLVALLITADNDSAEGKIELIAIFLSIATGMLLFLTRQRKKIFSRPILAAHGLFALVALLLVGRQLV